MLNGKVYSPNCVCVHRCDWHGVQVPVSMDYSIDSYIISYIKGQFLRQETSYYSIDNITGWLIVAYFFSPAPKQYTQNIFYYIIYATCVCVASVVVDC